MKFKLLITLIISLIIAQTLCKIEEGRSRHKHKMKTRKVHHKLSTHNGTASIGNSTNSTNSTTQTILNSIGRKVYVTNSSDIVISQWPIHLSRCDQVISFQGQFIPNHREFRARNNGTFTITAHYVNLFSTANADKLLRSVLLAESPIVPKILPGSGGCIMIYSAQGGDFGIPICLDDQSKSDQVLAALQTFSDCRAGVSIGDNITNKIDKLKVTEMIKTCGGSGKFMSPSQLMKALSKKKTTSLVGKKNADWFHAGSDGIPGTPEPKELQQQAQ